MDYFSKNKIVIWVIAILALLNIFTLSTIWFMQYRGPSRVPFREEPGHMRQGLRILEKELDLSADQIKVFDDIRQRHFEKMKVLQKEIFSLRQEIMDELNRTTPDTEQIRLLTIRIGEQETLKERYILKHFSEMKAACTPQQKEKFNRLLKKLMVHPQDRPDRSAPGSGPRAREFGFDRGDILPPFFDCANFIYD